MRYCPGPIVDRTMFEPQFCATPCVLIDEGVWKMWYLSCTEWFLEKGKPKHRYHLKYAESTDGIIWRRDGTIAIDYANPDEHAISRPSVIRDDDRWRMFLPTVLLGTVRQILPLRQSLRRRNRPGQISLEPQPTSGTVIDPPQPGGQG